MYAGMNVVAWALHQVDGEDRMEVCADAQADLAEIIKIVFTPDSAFEAAARRRQFKIVRPGEGGEA
jgi:hypothetical protein